MDLTTLIALPPALAYAVGLSTLWMQITEIYYLDFTTSWYAVALVPRLVTLGHGIRTLWNVLPLAFLFSFLVVLAFYLHGRYYRKDPKYWGSAPVMFLLIMFSVALLMLVLYFEDYSLAVLLMLRFLVGSLAFYSLWFLLLRNTGLHWNLLPYPESLYRYLRYSLIVLLLVTILWPGDLRLPYLLRGHDPVGDAYSEDSLPIEDAIEFRAPEGRLLAVTEGYWHVLGCGGEYVMIPTGGETVWFVDSEGFSLDEDRKVRENGEVNFCAKQ